jgi:endonuclease/exonuclease/phosphatase family metal-dependent hydrolase
VSTLRLGSFNLLSGRSLRDGTIDRDRLVEAITALDVDVLAVQEVDKFQPRSARIDQTALIATTLGAVTSRFVATVDGTPGEPGWTPSHSADRFDSTDRFDSAHASDLAQFGVALISRLPVAEWHVLRLKPPPGRFPLPIPSRPPRILWLNDEPRAVVAAVLEHPRITIACTHLSFVPLANARQLLTVRRWLARLPGPQVLLGDLNLPAVAARRLSGWTPLVSGPTFPSPSPRLQFDHVLAAGLPVGSRASGRVHRQLPISDHRAVQVDLDLPT